MMFLIKFLVGVVIAILGLCGFIYAWRRSMRASYELNTFNLKSENALLREKVAHGELSIELLKSKIASSKTVTKTWEDTREIQYHFFGQHLAQAVALLERISRKRGDGDIGEAKFLVMYVIEKLLMTDTEQREAAYRRSKLIVDDPNRERFSTPPDKATS